MLKRENSDINNIYEAMSSQLLIHTKETWLKLKPDRLDMVQLADGPKKKVRICC